MTPPLDRAALERLAASHEGMTTSDSPVIVASVWRPDPTRTRGTDR